MFVDQLFQLFTTCMDLQTQPFTPPCIPTNVDGVMTQRKQVMNINLTGPPTGNASETYEVFITELNIFRYNNINKNSSPNWKWSC